jgi:lipopolysaccharide biosynthesis protein
VSEEVKRQPRSRGVAHRVIRAASWTATGKLPQRRRERLAAQAIRDSGVFDSDFYLGAADVVEAGVDPVTHYVRHGAREGRLPGPLFDPRFYLERYPDIVEAAVEPLFHFVTSGAGELRQPHPWFDTAFYAEQVRLLAETGLNPVAHYLRVGAETGRDPHPDFDSAWYLETYPDVASAGMNPLVHYLACGGELSSYHPNSRVREASLRTSAPSAGVAVARREADGPRPLAVVLHLYYPDLWDELRRYLAQLGNEFDLFVSLCPDTAEDAEAQILSEYPDADVRYFENQGRDVGPFMEFLRDGQFSDYELVCKIHTKKSPHRPDGDRWRGTLLQQLLGAPEIVREIRDVFEREPRVGLLGPADQQDRCEESWGSNREKMCELARDLGMDEKEVRLDFFAGSMFWFRPAGFEALAALDLRLEDFEEERGQLDGTLHHALERIFPLAVGAAGYQIHPFVRPSHEVRVGTRVGDRRVRLIAFYLPQFHPIPENDEWWGPGFTEWSNVVQAKPLYEGHIQPRLPKDLGFYDLRVAETRDAQAQLAQRYGINGFCYYYYWFDGRRLLERPLDEVFQSGRPDFPFCVCWANENWTRRWDGLDQEVLVEQTYSLEASRRFIRELIPVLRDPRYIRYQGRPVLLVYRAKEIPHLDEVLALWRAEAAAVGMELHLCAVRFWDVVDVHALGFDAAVDFPPHHINVRDVTDEVPGLVPGFEGMIYDYAEAVRANLESRGHGYDKLTHRAVMLAWDNTARRGKSAHIAHGADPKAYREWLSGILEQEMRFNSEPESLVFINAWNEWGEGAALEPDQHFGMAYLESTQQALAELAERWKEGEPR